MNKRIIHFLHGLSAIMLFASASPVFGEEHDSIQVWQTFPWLKEDPAGNPEDRAMMPSGKALVQMANHEYETVCLHIENGSDTHLEYRLDLSQIPAIIPGMEVEVLSSWVTPIRYMSEKLPMYDKRFPPGETGDPLLPVTPERILHCPPMRTAVSG